jgi:hypothetical protein
MVMADAGPPLPLGFDPRDPAVAAVALAYRLLYAADLRELQTAANEGVAAGQALARSALDDPRANLQLSRGRHGY